MLGKQHVDPSVNVVLFFSAEIAAEVRPLFVFLCVSSLFGCDKVFGVLDCLK